MCNNAIQPAVISAVPFLGSTASPYAVQVNITQRLLNKCCAGSTPVFAPQFSIKGVSQVGDEQYAVTMHVEGIISYVPCGGGCGYTKQQPLSQDFVVYIQSATAPSVTLASGSTINSLAVTPCQSCSRSFVSETQLTLTVATA